MKKQYINPSLDIITIANKQQVLAGSPKIQNQQASKNGDGDYNDSRSVFWDDED